MNLKSLIRLLGKTTFALIIFIFSCTKNEQIWRYDKQIILQREDFQKSCEISIDSTFLVEDISEFDFQGRKKKLNVICTDSTNIGKYLMQQQIESELFYNGSFKLAGQMVHLISLHGHSRSSSGKTQGYLLFNGQKRKLLIKAFSVQPESEMVKFYLRNGYLLIMRINDYRDEVYPFTYAVLKLNDTSLNILEEAEVIKIFKEKLYNIKFEYSRSAME
ncbi:hypothetical protein [Pedobacter sp.]|uniref:hypothetical protein n=1 Tax=Pedobacter sp. TaxID=1411316 RepID=UPI0031D4020A